MPSSLASIGCDDARKLGNTSTTSMSDSSWGSAGARYVSKWFNGAASASSSALHASSKPSGAAGWLSGGFWRGGGGDGKSNNPGARGNLEDDEGEGEGEIQLGGRELNESHGQVKTPLAESAPSLNGPRLAPWLWIPALWGLYAALLAKSPMLTKAITAGVLAFGGDLMAQAFEFQRSGSNGRFVTVTCALIYFTFTIPVLLHPLIDERLLMSCVLKSLSFSQLWPSGRGIVSSVRFRCC